MLVPFLSTLLTISVASGRSLEVQASCKNIPGDNGWPSSQAWETLNNTVQGRLIATVPVAHVCHDQGAFSGYNETACANLRKAMQSEGAETLEPQPGEIMNPYFYNTSCSAFTSVDTPCDLGERAVYSIDVSGPADVQAGLDFVLQHNIRLVVKNTGLDYMGKSSGKGSLSLWMHSLKTIDVQDTYSSPSYSGPAVKIGAGVIAGEAIEAVSARGYRIVAPECGLCGFTGGYIQGVGHSQLASAYGFAADQVLEWEVVTPTGEYLTATPSDHADLYWALAGGGGGTYGVVLSTTVRAYLEGPAAGGMMIFNNTDASAFWEAVELWYSMGPAFVGGTPNNVQFLINNASLIVFAFVMPGQDTTAIDRMLAPFLPELDRRGLPYALTTANHSTYAANLVASYGALPYGTLCPVYPVLSSRLIPRATVLNRTASRALISVYREYIENPAGGEWFVGCSFLDTAINSSYARPAHPDNAVNPQWRESIAYCNPNNPWLWADPASSLAAKQQLSGAFTRDVEAATPGSGVYQNEVDSLYAGDWKRAMYGVNYDRLLRVKHAYDPERLLYGAFTVGADEVEVDAQGRLCTTAAV